MPGSVSPAAALPTALPAELRRVAPFGQMSEAAVAQWLAASREVHFSAGQWLLGPGNGPVGQLWFIRQGAVAGWLPGEEGQAPLFQWEAGDLFPVAACMGQRAVRARYRALQDMVCLALPVTALMPLVASSPALADFLNGRLQHYLVLSQRDLQQAQAERALAEQSLESRLDQLPAKDLISCHAGAPLRDALGLMHRHHVGSVLVLSDEGAAAGILTLRDLPRLSLAATPLDTPLQAVMSQPVQSLPHDATLQEAALLMAREGFRHVPVTQGGRVVNLVSERDLFALQRRTIGHVGAAIRLAHGLPELQAAAQGIRQLAAGLLAQGMQARGLTSLVSQLNDQLTARLVALTAQRHGLDLDQACWLAFGSEGRSEQTIATDQDNGLVFAGSPAEQPRWLALAEEVNLGLDACGYPLCTGNVMARNPQCCLTPEQWAERFHIWTHRGEPEDLLNASIYFDFRPVAGNGRLVESLREAVAAGRGQPKFLRLMAANAQRARPALTWLGGLDTQSEGGRAWIDLKLQGTAIFVEVARLYALAHGVAATNTRERLEQVAAPLKAPEAEARAWVDAFEFLQMLRLRVQTHGASANVTGNDPGHTPNRVALDQLSDIEQRMLKESLRVAKLLQQRMAMDFLR